MANCLKLFLFLLPSAAFAQDHYADSLKRELRLAGTDSVRYLLNSSIGFYYRTVNLDSALHYDDNAIAIARKNNQKLDEGYSLDEKGYALMSANKLAESLQNTLEAMKIASDPANEIKSWQQPLRGIRDPHQERLLLLASINHHMGHLAGKTNNLEQQVFYYKETIRLIKESKDTTVFIGFPHMNLGRVYTAQNKLDSALLLENEALRIFKAKNYKRYLPNVYLNLFNIHIKLGDTARGLGYLYASIPIAKETANLTMLRQVYSSLARYHIRKKEKDSSLYYSLKHLRLIDSIGYGNSVEAHYDLFESYELQNNKDSMLKYQGLALEGADSTSQAWIKSVSEFQNLTFEEQKRLQQLEKEKEETKTRNRIYALLAGLAALLVIGFILYRNNRQKQRANKLLQKTLDDLKSTQVQLIQFEKMASLGELTAGIAHEIQNPLNFVNNFAEVNTELLEELKADSANNKSDTGLLEEVGKNMERIAYHGKRADSIVKNMLQHSRNSSGVKEATDINALCDEYLRLSYHGYRAKDPRDAAHSTFNASFKTDFDPGTSKIMLIPQDFGRVLLNLFNNAFYAVYEKSIQAKKAGDTSFEPTVTVKTKRVGEKVEISIRDNGNGIPQKLLDKIFQPFFTTKPTGQGTGLGLSLSYDIITRGHGGELKVKTKEGEGTEFVIVVG